ncbi:MAG: exo-beta-N-acetylmuramidase NamZ domain-containing protein, partial [bacterium]
MAGHNGSRLVCLLSPEHGYFGAAPPGASLLTQRHPTLSIPVFSLYGQTKEPTAKMLRNVDTIVFDLQDIGARPYTYVSTLRLVLEAAAKAGKKVIVADRPIPLPRIIDGPITEDDCSSF